MTENMTREDLGNIDKWITAANMMIEGGLRTNWTDSERETFKKLDQLKREVKEAELRPDCYGAFGSEECTIVGCAFQDPCEAEETESFEKARRALNE